jgi:hypothetical protein
MNEEFFNWIEDHGLTWCDRLPYSGLPGWTNGKFSVIYEGEKTESLDSINARYKVIFG